MSNINEYPTETQDITNFLNKKEYVHLDNIVKYVSSKISVDEINIDSYVSTENMVSNLGGITKALNKPEKGRITEFNKNDILISNIRPYLKKIWFANEKGGCSSDILVLRNKSNINSKYLFYLLSSDKFFNYMMSTSKGTKMPRGDKKAILKFKIPIVSKEQQENIVSVLNALDEKIILMQKKHKNYENFSNQLLDEIINQKYSVPNSNNEWNLIRLSEIGSSFSGLSGKTKDDFGKGDSKYITYTSIFNNYIQNLSNLDSVIIKDGENQNAVQKGDIFFTGSSETPNEVGMSSVILEDVPNCYLNSFCFGYRLNSLENYNPLFLVYYFRSLKFRKELYKLAQGSTRFNISKKELLKSEIEIPDINEQNYYVNLITNCFNIKKELNNKIKQISKFKKGLLQQMFI